MTQIISQAVFTILIAFAATGLAEILGIRNNISYYDTLIWAIILIVIYNQHIIIELLKDKK